MGKFFERSFPQEPNLVEGGYKFELVSWWEQKNDRKYNSGYMLCHTPSQMENLLSLLKREGYKEKSKEFTYWFKCPKCGSRELFERRSHQVFYGELYDAGNTLAISNSEYLDSATSRYTFVCGNAKCEHTVKNNEGKAVDNIFDLESYILKESKYSVPTEEKV